MGGSLIYLWRLNYFIGRFIGVGVFNKFSGLTGLSYKCATLKKGYKLCIFDRSWGF